MTWNDPVCDHQEASCAFFLCNIDQLTVVKQYYAFLVFTLFIDIGEVHSLPIYNVFQSVWKEIILLKVAFCDVTGGHVHTTQMHLLSLG